MRYTVLTTRWRHSSQSSEHFQLFLFLCGNWIFSCHRVEGKNEATSSSPPTVGSCSDVTNYFITNHTASYGLDPTPTGTSREAVFTQTVSEKVAEQRTENLNNMLSSE